MARLHDRECLTPVPSSSCEYLVAWQEHARMCIRHDGCDGHGTRCDEPPSLRSCGCASWRAVSRQQRCGDSRTVPHARHDLKQSSSVSPGSACFA